MFSFIRDIINLSNATSRGHALIPASLRMMFLALCVCGTSIAQVAPEGNAHPKTQNLSESGSQLAPPFGQHNTDLTKVQSVSDKAAFAKQLDLSPLESLAVFHNGRVKVLQTLANESVAKITGRKRYVDYIKPQGSETDARNIKDVAFPTIFTLLDMVIDPAFYLEKPLVGVEYLPLREAFLDKQFPTAEDKQVRERWMRVARITPMMVDQHLRDIADQHMGEPEYSRALAKVDESVRLFMEGRANMVLVAPSSADQVWKHISTLSAQSPARVAATQLGVAWRALDAMAANEAIATLAAELPKINAEIYPTTKRSLEVTYNKVHAFEWGYWAYAFSLLFLLMAFGTGRTWLGTVGIVLLVAALGLHAFGFVLRCMIAERFAIQNQFESMTGVSLFAVAVGTTVMILRRQWLFGAASAAVGFMILLTATQAGIPGVFIEREAAILNTSVLLKYHVTTVLISYGLIALGCVCSVFYLGVHYFGLQSSTNLAVAGMGAGASSGGNSGGALAMGDVDGSAQTSSDNTVAGGNAGVVSKHRLLADLDTAQMISLQLAFWTLGVGILLGAWWADHSWGRWWAFDPKETWALVTWIVYLIVVHVRIAAPQNKGLTTAWLSIAGFIVMLWTYFGVNLLLPGLHAYA